MLVTVKAPTALFERGAGTSPESTLTSDAESQGNMAILPKPNTTAILPNFRVSGVGLKVCHTAWVSSVDLSSCSSSSSSSRIGRSRSNSSSRGSGSGSGGRSQRRRRLQ